MKARHFLLAKFTTEGNALLRRLACRLQQTEDPAAVPGDTYHLTLVYLGEKLAGKNVREFSLLPLRQKISFPEVFKVKGVFRFHSPEGDSAGFSLNLERCHQLEETISYLAREAGKYFQIHEKQLANTPHITLFSSEAAKNNPTVCKLPPEWLPASIGLPVHELELTTLNSNGFSSLHKVTLAGSS